MSGKKPTPIVTEGNLPFHELSWDRFEQLCLALLEARGHQSVRHWGAAGSEKGCDLVSVGPDGRRWVTQCKRTRKLSITEAEEEVKKVLTEPPDPRPNVYQLIATCALSRKMEEKLVDVAACTFDVKLVGLTELDSQVRRQDAVRHRFFGEPGKPRPYWNVPQRNPYFTGREDLLEELERRLGESGTAALQAIVGLGGVGKTQTAIEYCHKRGESYRDVFWTDASSAGALQADYARFAQKLGLAEEGAAVAAAATVFLGPGLTRDSWLLVLDSVDQPDEIRKLLPRSRSGHVIVTSRVERLEGFGDRALAVNVLPLGQATDFLLKRARRGRTSGERPAAETLARELGRLPLALEQAGAYAYVQDVDFGEYLDAYQRRRLEVLERKKPGEGDYEATVATTWEMNFQRLEAETPAAAEALKVMAFLAPDRIPAEALARGENPLDFAEQVSEPLRRYSLVRWERDKKSFSVHQLVQEVQRRRLEDRGETRTVLERAHRALAAAVPKEDSQLPASWPAWSRLLPHVQTGAGHWQSLAEQGCELDPTELWIKAGLYAWAAGRAQEARTLEEQALEVRRRVLGDAHPSTLISMNNLATTLHDLGDFEGARKLLEQALKGCREFGDDHLGTLAAMNNLADILRHLGDFEGARKLHEQELNICRRVLGAEHPSTLTSMNNLALAIQALGDAESARKLQDQALKACQRELGDEHPITLSSMHNLATKLHDLGDFEDARQLLEQALEGRRRELGDEHPSTLKSMANLAGILHALGDVKGARKLVREVCDRNLGPEHMK